MQTVFTQFLCRCASNSARYACPSCNTPYCGVECYQKHDLRCTERFHAAHVKNVLDLEGSDAKHATLEILKADVLAKNRDAQTSAGGAANSSSLPSFDDDTLLAAALEESLHGNAPVDTDSISASSKQPDADFEVDEERFAELCGISDALSAEHLTSDEKQAFLAAVRSGRLTKSLEDWKPWWAEDLDAHRLAHKGPLVQDVEVDHEHPSDKLVISATQTNDDCIWLVPEDEQLPRFSELTKVTPPPEVAFHMLEMLYAYCHTLRLYAGDISWDSEGVAAVLLTVSKALGGVQRYSDAVSALSSAAAAAQAEGVRFSAVKQDIMSLSDMFSLLRYRHFVVDAFFQMHTVIKSACLKLPKDAAKRAVNQLNAAARKAEFFAAFTNDEDAFPTISLIAMQEDVRSYLEARTIMSTSGKSAEAVKPR